VVTIEVTHDEFKNPGKDCFTSFPEQVCSVALGTGKRSCGKATLGPSRKKIAEPVIYICMIPSE
jgi:hypothetical protein